MRLCVCMCFAAEVQNPDCFVQFPVLLHLHLSVCLSARLHQWVEDFCVLIGQLLIGINVKCVTVMMMKSFLCAADCLQTDFQWSSLK